MINRLDKEKEDEANQEEEDEVDKDNRHNVLGVSLEFLPTEHPGASLEVSVLLQQHLDFVFSLRRSGH